MIQLYRKGDTHTVRGIKCELCNFSNGELEYQLNEGWLKSPEDIDNNEEASEEGETQELHPVRIQARDAEIEGWETKRIKTLQADLDAVQG